MTNSVTFPTAVGGDGSTVDDSTSATTGLDNGGFRTRLIPALGQVVNIAQNTVTQATNAATSASTALNAPGTQATSTTSLTIGFSQQTLTIQTGKSIVAGMPVMCAVTASASANYMHGTVDSYNSSTGQLLFTPDAVKGSGTYAAWTVSLAGPVGQSSGGAVAIDYTFSTTTTDADPGNGTLRLDNATQNIATTIRADLLGNDTADYTGVLGTFTASSSATSKGTIRLVKKSDPTKYLLFNVTALASPSGYRNITVTCTASSAASPFANGDIVTLHFSRTGDASGTGGAVSGNISAGRTLTVNSAGVQYVTPNAVGVKDTLPDATTLSAGIGKFFHKNENDTYQQGIVDNGGTLRAVVGPGGTIASNLADNSTAAGTWAFDCTNEDGALALCEQIMPVAYTGVLSLMDGNGGASVIDHCRQKTAKFISTTAAVSVVTSGSSTYLVGFDDTGVSAAQLLDSSVATVAMVVRTSATSGFVVWGYTNAVKLAGFTISGNTPSVGAVTTLSSAITPTANAAGANGGMSWIGLDDGATWIVTAAATGTAGTAWTVTMSGNTASGGTGKLLQGTGGMPMLFSTGTSTFGTIAYQSGSAAAAKLNTYSVSAGTISDGNNVNYVASTGSYAKPSSVKKLTGTTNFAFTYGDGTIYTNVVSITGGTTISLGTAVNSTLTDSSTAYSYAINVYDSTHYTLWNGAGLGAQLHPRYYTVSAGSPSESNPGISIGSSSAQVVAFLDNATTLISDGNSTAGNATWRKVLFSGSSFALTGAAVESDSNYPSELNSGSTGATICGAAVVSGAAGIIGGMKYSILNGGRFTRYIPRLHVGTTTAGILVDANSAGTRVASMTKDFNGHLVPLILQIPTY
jgi:hypothetical protein